MTTEATPEGAEEDGLDEVVESGSKAEWFAHPETARQRKELREILVKQTKEMVRQGLKSTDPDMRGLASQIWTLEAQVLTMGGQGLIWPEHAAAVRQRAVRR